MFQRGFFILFWVFILGFSFWLMFHTFSYDQEAGAMLVASKVWSDFGAHIPLIRSFSFGDNWPIEYPLFPGEPIRYHFLFYFLAGMLEKVGLRIDWALNLPSALGFFLLLVMIYLFSRELFDDKRAAFLSLLFFLFNGSLSFLRFLGKHPLSRKTIADVFQVRDFPSFAPWGPGPVSAFWNLNIYTNQRHLGAAFGLALLFIFSSLRLTRVSFRKQRLWAIFWGVLIGFFPYFHQPTLLILAVFIICYFIFFPKIRLFLLTVGAISMVLIIPQLLLLVNKSRVIEWYPGYLIHNEFSLGRFLFYWWQNLGFHSFLILAGFATAPRRVKKALFPIFILFALGNLFKFSQEASSSHKLFNFFLILGEMGSACLIVRLFVLTKGVQRLFMRLGLRVLLTGLVFFLVFSGIIDFFVVKNDTKISVVDILENKAAAWILKQTSPGAMFLNSSYFFHPASLAGRKIFMGWPYFSWSLGYTEDRFSIMKTIYESKNPEIFCPILKKRGISYVTVEERKGDPNLPVIESSYFFDNFRSAYREADRQYGIFSREDLCGRGQ